MSDLAGYNSYTNEWEEWNTNPLKKHTFDQYKKNIT